MKHEQAERDQRRDARLPSARRRAAACAGWARCRAAPAPLAHTFSTSGRPRMPVGRKISTMMRIEKAATSLYSIEK